MAALSPLWSYKQILRIDWRVIPIILILMIISILVISSQSVPHTVESLKEVFSGPDVKKQLEWFSVSLFIFFLFAGLDYHMLRELSWILYILVVLSLLGLFFTDSIQRVHRWYRLPLLGVSFQPSEYAKLGVVIALSWFLERRRERAQDISTTLLAALIVGIPFLLILKQPDLGSALVLFPITLVMFYYGDINPWIVRLMTWFGACLLVTVALFFLGVIPHEAARPYATKIMKEYQYERLNPNNFHQHAATMAIGVGGLFGAGWREGEYSGGGFLPAPYTDSVFPAFGEEFGFVGLFFLMALFYALIYVSFQVTAVAKDHFGRLLSAGISVYLAMHILVNIGMMCGILPITGVPLVLVTYGGSSVLATMIALGILQSIYSRRFMF